MKRGIDVDIVELFEGSKIPELCPNCFVSTAHLYCLLRAIDTSFGTSNGQRRCGRPAVSVYRASHYALPLVLSDVTAHGRSTAAKLFDPLLACQVALTSDSPQHLSASDPTFTSRHACTG